MATNINRIGSFLTVGVISMVLCAGVTGTANASENDVEATQPTVEAHDDHSVTFNNVNALQPDQSFETTVTDSKGQEVTVGIEAAPNPSMISGRLMKSLAASSSKRWKVWYYAGTTNASYWMTVSNNRVTGVDSWWIWLAGSTYTNVKLYHTASYGQLDFDESTYLGILSAKFWLRGSVTGKNNQIKISY